MTGRRTAASGIVCHRCWMAEHPRPTVNLADIDGSRGRLWSYLRYVSDLHDVELKLLEDRPSLYEQHREAYARAGDPAEMERMLRHVELEDGPAGDVWVKMEPHGQWAVPWAAAAVWLALVIAAFLVTWLAT